MGLCVGLCFGVDNLMSFLFCNHLDEEKKAGCFAFIVFWVSCYCICHLAHPHGAMGWSAFCDCGIS